MSLNRRRAGGRRTVQDRPSVNAPYAIEITSVVPLYIEVGQTHQTSVEVRGFNAGNPTSVPGQDTSDPLSGFTVTYTSSDPGVATVNAAGVVTGVGAGTTTITAKTAGLSDAQVYTFASPLPSAVSIVVSPSTLSLAEGDTGALQAGVYDGAAGSGNVLTGQTVTWASLTPASATVSADSGTTLHATTVTAIVGGASGTAVTVRATSGVLTADCTVTVFGPATLVPSAVTVSQVEGTTFALSWTVQDSRGIALSGRTVTAASSNTNLATVGAVSASGSVHSCTVTLVANGTVTITGTITGTSPAVTNGVVFTVLDAPGVPAVPSTLSAVPGSINQVEGSTRDVVFTPRDQQGNALSPHTVTAASSNTAVATVSAVTVSGTSHTTTVTLVADGTANVTGTITSVTPNISVVVPVTSTDAAAGVQPAKSIDFASYANFTALHNDVYNASTNPNGVWSGIQTGEVAGVSNQSLVVAGDGPVGGYDRYLRYTYPTLRASPICTYGGIYRNVEFPKPYPTKCWIRVVARFSSTFDCVGAGGCVSGYGLKFIFGRTNGPRFDLFVALGGVGSSVATRKYTFGYPNNEVWITQAGGTPTGADYQDGDWHEWKFLFDVGAAGIGGRAAFWFEGVKIRDTGTVNMTGAINPNYVRGYALARNMNVLPVLASDITLDWGIVQHWFVDPGWT